MTRAYSLDLRERVVFAVSAGESCRSVAARFEVSVSSVVKWSQRYRRTGSPAAYKRKGRRPFALVGERDWLLGRIAEKPDLTLRGLVVELAERGRKVSYYAVWHFFKKEGVSFKKACGQANRIALMSPGAGSDGSDIRDGSIPGGWSSSMRPGPRQT